MIVSTGLRFLNQKSFKLRKTEKCRCLRKHRGNKVNAEMAGSAGKSEGIWWTEWQVQGVEEAAGEWDIELDWHKEITCSHTNKEPHIINMVIATTAYISLLKTIHVLH